MTDIFSALAFDPLISNWAVITLGVIIFLASLLTATSGLKSYFWRLLAGLFLLLAVLNPQKVNEDRTPLSDSVIILNDVAQSMQGGERERDRQSILNGLREGLEADPTLDIVQVDVQGAESGTKLSPALVEALGTAGSNRIAGVIALTDGQAHDNIETLKTVLPENVPFHALVVGDPEARDRRIRAVTAPRFGLVGETADFELEVDDPGFEGERALIEVKLNGTIRARFPITIGETLSIPLEIERRGSNTVEMNVVPAEGGELTLNNNVFVSEISGIRDRMRVLLITGEPHSGGRAWRNLLKSDPAIDLVQFTILTMPRVNNPNARQNELSLIQFPTRRLFEEKLDEFDLIIFDHYRRRANRTRSGGMRPIITPNYFNNMIDYVEDGGALLLATGPSFAAQDSLFRSPLAGILPTRPTGEVTVEKFRPSLNEKGRRHPITSSFKGQTEANWGQWFRLVDNTPVSGNVLMEGAKGAPLFVIDQIGEGRVAMLMSDQAWLWSKSYDGGGPYREIFRRTAHWLMGEPDLEAETLRANTDGQNLIIERRSLEAVSEPVSIIIPDGKTISVTLSEVSDGVFRGLLPEQGFGAYRLEQGDVSTITAIGTLNPKEYADLTPTIDMLRPLAEQNGGFIKAIGLGDGKLPTVRRVALNDKASGEAWLGLRAYQDYVVTRSQRQPLVPALLFFVLFFLSLAVAWWREGL
jgi:uncharacterized membrane protein